MFDAAPANSQQGRRRVVRAGLDRMLGSFELQGSLTLRYPNGSETVFSGPPGPARALEIKTWAAARRILINPNLAFGEAYVDGSLVLATGDVQRHRDRDFGV